MSLETFTLLILSPVFLFIAILIMMPGREQ